MLLCTESLQAPWRHTTPVTFVSKAACLNLGPDSHSGYGLGSLRSPVAGMEAEAVGLGFWLCPWSLPSQHQVRIPRGGGSGAVICHHGLPPQACTFRPHLGPLGLVFPRGCNKVMGRSDYRLGTSPFIPPPMTSRVLGWHPLAFSQRPSEWSQR